MRWTYHRPDIGFHHQGGCSAHARYGRRMVGLEQDEVSIIQ